MSTDFNIEDKKSLTPAVVEEIYDQIENLGVKEIELLQKQLHSDYKSLAKEFSESRVARVDAYLEKIEQLQQELRKNYNAYETFVQDNLPALDPLTGTASRSLHSIRSIKRKMFDEGVITIPSSSSSKLTGLSEDYPQSPALEPIPIFTDSFEKLLKPHRESLKSLKNNYKYESKLLEDSTKRNVELTWRQSIKDKIEARKKLRKELFTKKYESELDYFNVTRNSKSVYNESRYRVSTKKVGERRKHHDVSHISKSVKARVEQHPKVILYPSNLPAATSTEIQNDLTLMKDPAAPIKVSTIESNHFYLEKPEVIQPHIGPTTMTDIVNEQLEGGHKYQMMNFSSVQGQFSTQAQGQVPNLVPAPVSNQSNTNSQPQLGAFQPSLYNLKTSDAPRFNRPYSTQPQTQPLLQTTQQPQIHNRQSSIQEDYQHPILPPPLQNGQSQAFIPLIQNANSVPSQGSFWIGKR